MHGRDRQRFVRRAWVLLGCFCAGLALAGVRSATLQIYRHDELAQLARGQYLNSVKVPARRGHIYDRSGKPLAISVEVPSVFANPSRIADPRQAARKLAPVLALPLAQVYDRLAGDKLFVWLKRQVTPDIAEQVEALGIDGVGITRETKRFYPNREVGAHVIGFAGMDAKGLEGIERALDDALAGEPQVVSAVRDARGNAILAGLLDPEQLSKGSDVELTLDLPIQDAAETALEQAVRETGAESATAVVLDPRSGELLAVAVAPRFNANQAAQVDAATRRNRALTDMFEPGSTMKPLIMAAALESRAVERNAKIFCENGRYRVGDHVISDTTEHAWLTPSDIIRVSSNVGAAKVGRALGRERMAHYLGAFGFGRRPGLGFPGESGGLVRPSSAWSEVGVATISYGHGVAVTAVQLAAAYGVLASGGVYRAPRLIRSTTSPGGERRVTPVDAGHRVLSERTVRSITEMLGSAVGESGTGWRAQVPGYSVAGKTGTAQKVDSVAGGYSNDRYVAVFSGFVPAEAPRAVIVVALDEPKRGHTGGAVAAPVFARIARDTMQQLGVVPRDAGAPSAPTGEDAEEVAAQVQSVARAAAAPRPGTLPSFLGLTARRAVEQYNAMGASWDLELQGTGYVVEQEPAPGSNATPARVRLVLAQR